MVGHDVYVHAHAMLLHARVHAYASVHTHTTPCVWCPKWQMQIR